MKNVENIALVNDAPRARVVSTVRQWIEQGMVTGGERLPSIQRLSQKLDVSRPTVRAALRELERDGIIRAGEKNARIIVAVPVRHSRPSMMSQTICIFSDTSAQVPGYQRQSGWWSHTVASAAAAVAEQGRHILVVQPNRLNDQQLREFLEEKPLGIIMIRAMAVTQAGQAMIKAIREAGVPLVIYGNHPRLAECDTIASDHEAGAYLLTRWLIDQGRRRIVRYHTFDRVDNQMPDWLHCRDAGHERAMREAGLEILPAIIGPFANGKYPSTRETFETNVRICASYLIGAMSGVAPADAIMSTSDGPADDVTAACRFFGRVPGKDVLVTGYDNYWRDLPTRAWEPVPPAATIDKKNLQLGQALVRMLIDRLEGAASPSPEHRLVSPELVMIPKPA